MDSGFNLNSLLEIPEQLNPLILSCKNGDLKKVKYYIEEKHHSVNEKDSEGDSVLHWACAKDYLHIVEYLIEKGFNNLKYKIIISLFIFLVLIIFQKMVN